jgi:uncharacterized protein (DUF427 family)
VRLPSAIHPIDVAPFRGRVTAQLDGQAVARSERALALDEAGHPRVFYLPREDVDMGHFTRTERRSLCPFKGIAAHYTIDRDGRTAENAAWSYECPNPALRAIAGHVAFYPGKVEIEATAERGENDGG